MQLNVVVKRFKHIKLSADIRNFKSAWPYEPLWSPFVRRVVNNKIVSTLEDTILAQSV